MIIKKTAYLIAIATALAVGAGSISADPKISADVDADASIELGGTFLDVIPRVSYETGVLRVAGPAGFTLSKRFNGQEIITADLLYEGQVSRAHGGPETLDKATSELEYMDTLPNGQYRYEVTLWDADQKRHYQSGSFFAIDGNLVSTEAVTPPLRYSDKDGTGSSELEVGTKSLTETDFITITDDAADDNTGVNMENSTAGLTGKSVRAIDGTFRIQEGSSSSTTPLVTVDADGRIGQNTATPGNSLHLLGGSSDGLRIQDDVTGGLSTWDIQVDGFSGLIFEDVETGNNVVEFFDGAPTGSLVMDSGGNFGFGTNSPLAPLHVGAGSESPRLNATTIMAQENGDTGLTFRDSRVGIEVFLLAEGSSANPGGVFGTLDAFPFEIRTNNSSRIHIAAGGNIGLGGVRDATSPVEHSNGAILTSGGAWQDASSMELKQDIKTVSIDEALDAVQDLEPVSFEYKSEESERRLGFIAEHVPELVATKERKTLSSMEIVAALTAVVKEQQEKLEETESIKSENRRLRERLERIEEKLGLTES